MKILVVADVPSRPLWDFYEEGKLKGIDLILSAGDLPAEYLSFLVTFASCPLLYVHGNHDSGYSYKSPEGCICIDDKIYNHEGVRILGLGGSMRYRPGEWQYTEKEMTKRARSLLFPIWINRGFDILLTHAPAKGLNDGSDLCHQGFSCFHNLMERYEPKYMVHGHVHMNYGPRVPRISEHGRTTVVNAYEKFIIEYPGH